VQSQMQNTKVQELNFLTMSYSPDWK